MFLYIGYCGDIYHQAIDCLACPAVTSSLCDHDSSYLQQQQQQLQQFTRKVRVGIESKKLHMNVQNPQQLFFNPFVKYLFKHILTLFCEFW